MKPMLIDVGPELSITLAAGHASSNPLGFSPAAKVLEASVFVVEDPVAQADGGGADETGGVTAKRAGMARGFFPRSLCGRRAAVGASLRG